MIFRERKQLNKNFIIAGAVVLVIGLAVAIGVSLVDEPLDGNLPEGETTITGQGLPEYAGETLIYEDDGEEACRAVSFVPGRVLWLSREVQHSIRPPSHACPTYRFTFACFFECK